MDVAGGKWLPLPCPRGGQIPSAPVMNTTTMSFQLALSCSIVLGDLVGAVFGHYGKCKVFSVH